MKSLLVAVASIFFAVDTHSKTNRPEITDTFSDSITSLTEDHKALIVRFQRQSSIFEVALDHPQFSEIKAKLEKAKKIAQKVKVVAIIPSMTIKTINE